MSANGPITNGNLIQVSGSASVYLMIFGQACGIPDPPTAANLFGASWDSNVQQITQAQLNALFIGPTLTSGSCLVQPENNASIYLFTLGLLFGIAGPPIMDEYNFVSGTVFQIPATVVQAMPQGFLITN